MLSAPPPGGALSYLTPSERRAALLIVLLLGLGTAHDLWRLRHPRAAAPFPGPAGDRAPDPAGGDSTTRRAPVAERPAAGSGAAVAPARNPLDLNRATVAELDALPGVGPVLAGRIVEQRRKSGPFREVDELLAVRGIGPRLLERLRPHVTVRP